MSNIEWANIKNFENYMVSNKGEVKNIKTDKIRKLRQDKDGYLTVSLWKNNKETNCKVHRLVSSHFVRGYFEGAVVNHKDENRQNNDYTNLEWCTVEYNNKYNDKMKKCYKKVNMYDLNNNYIRNFESLEEVCVYFKKTKGNLSSHLKGKQKTFAGYIFKYTDSEFIRTIKQ